MPNGVFDVRELFIQLCRRYGKLNKFFGSDTGHVFGRGIPKCKTLHASRKYPT